MHLESPRRQQFRNAREVILGARGYQTLLAEEKAEDAHPQTAILDQSPEGGLTGLELWLADKDFVYPLRVGLNTVGRSPDNDVVIQDGYVSRRHCTILVHTNNRAELFDTASKNGTYVNGHKLSTPTRLRPGDEIRMCDRHLVFMSRTPPAAQAPDTATLAD
jgi:hypothetical protein